MMIQFMIHGSKAIVNHLRNNYKCVVIYDKIMINYDKWWYLVITYCELSWIIDTFMNQWSTNLNSLNITGAFGETMRFAMTVSFSGTRNKENVENCSETLNIWKYIVVLWYDMNRNRLKCEGYKHRNIEQLHDMFSSMPRHTSCDKFTVQSKWTWNLGRCITITKLSFPSSMLHAPFFGFFWTSPIFQNDIYIIYHSSNILLTSDFICLHHLLSHIL